MPLTLLSFRVTPSSLLNFLSVLIMPISIALCAIFSLVCSSYELYSRFHLRDWLVRFPDNICTAVLAAENARDSVLVSHFLGSGKVLSNGTAAVINFRISMMITERWMTLKRYFKLILYVKLRSWPSAGVILGQRRRQWASISPTLVQRVLFTRGKLNVVRRAVDAFLGKCLSKDLS